jgi:hypothetical protein
MLPSRHPRSGAQRVEGATQRGGFAATPTAKNGPDDRPTTPPPFDVEALARQSIAMDSDRPPVDPIAQGLPQGIPGRDLEEILRRATVSGGAPSLWVPTTTRPVTLSTGPLPLRPPLSAGVNRTSIALGGIAALSLVVLGSASVHGGGRTRAGAQGTSATVRAVAPAPITPVVALPPDLPVVMTVIRTAATPSAVRALPQVVPPPSVASASPGCQPPYVIDAETGKKHWKLECL